MNKVITINLAGRLITIDELAYQQLQSYLGWLSQFFSKEEGGQEIYKDIEDRIAELFDEKLKKSQASINEEDVHSIIMIMGSPEQIAMETADGNIENGTNTSWGEQGGEHFTAEKPPVPEIEDIRLSRNIDDKVLGGVCSGLANHFKMDTGLVRILMLLGFFLYGATFFLYIILWIFLPARNIPSQASLNRKWYRSAEGKVLGGVCAGLSYPFNIKVYWLRIIFAFPLMGIIFFAIIHEHQLLKFCVAALPTLTLFYIVLWIALPMAHSITQKMELKGEPLNIKGINTALREEKTDTVDKVQRSESIIVVLFRIFAYIILGFVLLIVATVLISLIIALLGVLLGFSAVGLSLFSISDLIFSSDVEAYVLFGSLLVLLISPVVVLLRWLITKISKTPQTNKKNNYSISAFFIAALFCTIYILSGSKNSFQYKYLSSTPLVMAQVKDTLTLSFNNNKKGLVGDEDFNYKIRKNVDGSYDLPIASLDIQASENDSFKLVLQKKSYGKDEEQARRFVENCTFDYQTDSQNLKLPKYVNLKKNTLFRGQLLTAVLYVPKGRVFKIDNIPPFYSKNWDLSFTPFISININDYKWNSNTIYKMSESGKIESIDEVKEIKDENHINDADQENEESSIGNEII
ncbi:MAG TPA: PspC domain-containing protein [Edaphocola sp.]|nr:PspC domain-containing protein [Edaphocola sp.]